MPATVRLLLGAPDLKLSPLGAVRGGLDTPLSWVHSSDLVDPTPFLDPGHALLTTGAQFTAPEARDHECEAYVARLLAAGTRALGFGTGVVRETVPDSLIGACASGGLPLFEVPYSTPFIAVVRFVADMAARDIFARSTWALEAQHAISLAATRTAGLTAILAELSRQLGHWVVLYRQDGAVDRMFPADALGESAQERVSDEVLRLLRAERRSSRVITVGEELITLQTLGAGGALRGVLAVSSATPLDTASQQVVTSVIGLAGLALEQNHSLDRARSHLRIGVLRLLLGGDTDLASATAGEMWGGLPAAPVQLALGRIPPDQADALAERLDSADGSSLFYALDDERLILIARSGSTIFTEIASDFHLALALSTSLGYGELPRGRQQAEQTLGRLAAAVGLVEFDSLSAKGMLALLATADAREVAHALLLPLLESDRNRGSDLIGSLRAWLDSGAQYEAAARVLGVHRHTLRSRIAEAERLLGRDLSSFPARAELWAALSALQAP